MASMRSMSTLVLLLLVLVAKPARVVAGCCDVCLAQTDPARTEVAYDPLVHSQCSAVKGICCYGCDFAHGSITFQDGVTFDATSGAPVATAGTRIHFAFNSVARVTYDFLRLNQKKTSFVGNQSTSADVEGTGVFSICVPSAGTIALRGWGADSCKQVTAETSITVNAAASGASTTCSAAGTVKPADTSSSKATGTTKPMDTSGSSKGNQAVNSLDTGTSTSKTGKFDVANCNPSRGSVIKSGDTAVCDCAGDWRNPPACDEYSWTKTVLTIAGAVATVLSIAISVRVYVNSRKAKSAANAEEVVIDDRVSEDVLRLDRRSPTKSPTPSSTRTSTTPAVSSGVRSPPIAQVKAVRETTL